MINPIAAEFLGWVTVAFLIYAIGGFVILTYYVFKDDTKVEASS